MGKKKLKVKDKRKIFTSCIAVTMKNILHAHHILYTTCMKCAETLSTYKDVITCMYMAACAWITRAVVV